MNTNTRIISTLALLILSRLLGLAVGVYSVYLVYTLSSLILVVIGLLFFGVGVVFAAVIVTALKGMFDVTLILVCGSITAYLLQSASIAVKNTKPSNV